MSDSEQCSNRLELDLISLLVDFSCELKQIVIQVQWAIPIKTIHFALMMQVVLKIYIYYNDKLFGIFQWFHKNQISCLDGLIKHGTLLILLHVLC